MNDATVKYGQVDWDDAHVSTGNDFMKLEQGSNVVRIFSKPYQFAVHWVKDTAGTSRKVKCADKNCPLCKKGIKAQYRWLLRVLDRRDNIPKLLEISSQVFLGIKNYVSNPKWGDIKMYDVDIKRGPKGTQPLYIVMAEPDKGPLSNAEKETAKAFMERVDIEKFIKPATPEEIAEKLGPSFASSAAVSYAVGDKVVTTKEDGDVIVSDDDFNFSDDDIS
jgi:hypothetical protein